MTTESCQKNDTYLYTVLLATTPSSDIIESHLTFKGVTDIVILEHSYAKEWDEFVAVDEKMKSVKISP